MKNAGVRKRSWYEQGSAKTKKRAYCCGLCHLEGHTRQKCELRQVFAEDKDASADDDEGDAQHAEVDGEGGDAGLIEAAEGSIGAGSPDGE